MASQGVAVRFDWRGANAWENDFEDPASGGSDRSWVDSVDAAWYTGHGWSGGFTFKGKNDTTSVTPGEISWGDNRVNWVQLESCDVLADTTGTNDYFGRWGPPRPARMCSLHGLLGHSQERVILLRRIARPKDHSILGPSSLHPEAAGAR